MVLVFAFLFYLFFSFFKSASYFYLEYATSKATEIVNLTINNSIRTKTFSTLKDNEIFFVSKNSNDEIEMIDYNTYSVNLFLDEVSSTVTSEIDSLVKKDNLFTIPFFSLFNNPLVSNVGPLIPVKLQLVGAVYSNVEVKIKEYGINNCLIEIYIELDVKARVILPIISKEIYINNEIPISYKVINGKIPEYYGGVLSKNSSIYSIPIE